MTGPDQRMTLLQVMKVYIELFGEGPPIFGMGEEEAMAGVVKAIASGKPMAINAEAYFPELFMAGDGYFSESSGCDRLILCRD